MRPINLEVKGFSAFRETAKLSFEGADLVAFVGPTGSGKSSLIDAMTFALFGNVARYDDQRVVEPFIHQLAVEARVRLDFEVAGERYTAVRVATRTKTGATTKEARLVRVGADGAEQILAGSAREMPDAVRRVVGLDFEQFTRTVVLPQGAFAVFLHADKGTRQKLLRQLLDVSVYEKMGQLARTRAGAAQGRLGALTEQRDAKADVTPEQLAALEARIALLGALQVTVTKRLDEVAVLVGRIGSLTGAVDELAGVAAALGKIAVPKVLATLAPLIAEADAALASATAALESARVSRDDAQVALANGPDVADLEARLTCLGTVARLRRDIEALAPDETAAVADAVAAEAAARAAAETFEQADSALRTATTAAGLGAAIDALVVGEPCPVCAQTVHTLPGHDVDAELKRAKKAFASAKKAHASATRESADRARESDAVVTRLEAMRTELEREATRFPPGDDENELRSRLASAKDLQVAFDDALRAVTSAEAAEAEAKIAVEGHRKKEIALRQDLTRARDTVMARRPPSPDGRSIQDDWTVFVSWAGEQRAAVDRELAEVRSEVAELTASRRQLMGEVEAACVEVGVTGPVERAKERIATEAANAQRDLDAAKALRQERADLVSEIADLESVVTINQEMGRLLSASGFERWLVQSAVDDLLARATGRLFELSGGQFSFVSEDGELSIRDHRNGDEVRSVRSLSGGETFLASLALALALAESIADMAVEGGPRIESMFLDEGFGTLDDDARDLVATTLEELSASGRLIGIVTHIRDLADRMPVRFEVSKDSHTSRVDRVEV